MKHTEIFSVNVDGKTPRCPLPLDYYPFQSKMIPHQLDLAIPGISSLAYLVQLVV